MEPDSQSFTADEFNRWAETYDISVFGEEFPFIGYRKVLETIVNLAGPCQDLSILELGIGTGNLARLFSAQGASLTATDFSAAMLAKTHRKIPSASLLLHDLREPLPFRRQTFFDRIVSAYTFHHFDLPEKIRIIHDLHRSHLHPGGKIILGDIAFQDDSSRKITQAEVGTAWEAEYYWLADESLAALERDGLSASYFPVSSCAGIFMIDD